MKSFRSAEVSPQQSFNKFVLILIIVNLLFSILAFVWNFTPEKKVVYVDAIRLISKYEGTDDARKDLNIKSQSWQANLDTLKHEVDQVMETYEKNKASASAKEKALMEELIKSKQQQFLSYEQSVKEQYQKQDQEISQQLLNKVNDYIKRYGEDQGYTIILAATHYGNIAYADKSLDITESVLEGLNREYQKMR
jgi:outer membrane protein